MEYTNEEVVRDAVKKYYGETLQTKDDLKTTACTQAGRLHYLIEQIIANDIPDEILEKYYGCGGCIPMGCQGLNMLDLGSGSGRDCYICSKLVGESGKVFGVDMTDPQLEVANKYIEEYTKKLGYSQPNLKFFKGFIELLDDIPEFKKPENKIDICISNCVVNLSPRKDQVLQGVYNLLKKGGEFYFSDVYCDRRVPEIIRKNEILHGECIAGAMYVNDFISLAKKIGFTDPRIVSVREMKVTQQSLKNLLGEAKFYSITFRLFKLEDLEENCEDYGQYAIYNGTIEGFPHSYALDKDHKFETNKPNLVCGNTASMLKDSWLGKYFTVFGDRKTHFGQFQNCGNVVGKGLSETETQKSPSTSSSCCGGSTQQSVSCCSGIGGCC